MPSRSSIKLRSIVLIAGATALVLGAGGAALAGPAVPADSAGPVTSSPLPSKSDIATLHWWTRPVTGSKYKFANPRGVAFDGSHIWVVNSAGNSLTEINPSDGSLVRVVSAAADKLKGPNLVAFDGRAFDGHRLWTANFIGQSVSAIPAG